MMNDKSSEDGMRTTGFHAVIDRIEDNEIAVVLLGDDEKDQIDLPVSFLPSGATDGDHLRITITLDEESRDAMQEKIRKLQEELLNRGKT